jgi:hypothetical protein
MGHRVSFSNQSVLSHRVGPAHVPACRPGRRCLRRGVARTRVRGVRPARAEWGITIDCSLGGGFVPPGTIIDLPAAGELPAIKVICGDDGKWHVSAAIVKRGSVQLAAAPVSGAVLLKK